MMKRNPTTLKTMSWMVVSSIFIGGCAWYASCSFWVGFCTAMYANIFKIPTYFVHEWMWGKVIFKPDLAPPAESEVVHAKNRNHSEGLQPQ